MNKKFLSISSVELYLVLNEIKNNFNNYNLSFDKKDDPEEPISFLQITIESTDKRKMDRYFTLIDSLSKKISIELSKYLIFDIK